jgi:hypothetical protein
VFDVKRNMKHRNIFTDPPYPPGPECEHVYAIIRFDFYDDRDIPLCELVPEDRITVKKLVWTTEEAQAEVDRLNRINADKGCVYFWQTTRLTRHAHKEPAGEIE